jgi:long-chain acyl-CoA synthetase
MVPTDGEASNRSGPSARGPSTWVFDVDGCLVDSITGTSLRPGAADLLAAVRAAGGCVVLWSAGGVDHARRRAAHCGITGLVDHFGEKDGRDDSGAYRWSGVPLTGPVVFVDDRPEDLPADQRTIAVSPYLAPNPHDVVLLRLVAQLGLRPAV